MITLKISLIKSKSDKESFRMFKGLGFNVVEIEDLDETDNQIKKLLKEQYKTIVLKNEVAGFSEDIIKRYKNMQDINIIITSNKYKE